VGVGDGAAARIKDTAEKDSKTLRQGESANHENHKNKE
jgi:hypothetical protein